MDTRSDSGSHSSHVDVDSPGTYYPSPSSSRSISVPSSSDTPRVLATATQTLDGLQEEERLVMMRFFRDVEIRSCMRQLIGAIGSDDKHFEGDAQQLVEHLEQMGVHVAPLPQGKMRYAECTHDEWNTIHDYLLQHRREFSDGVLDMDGVTPLSVAPKPRNMATSTSLADHIQFSVPGLSPQNFSIFASNAPFRNPFGQFFDNALGIPEKFRHFEPKPPQAKEYLHYLGLDIMPGLRRAVAGQTTWRTLQVSTKIAESGSSDIVFPEVKAIYDGHDGAVQILDVLAMNAKRVQQALTTKKFQNVDDGMSNIRAGLIELHAL